MHFHAKKFDAIERSRGGWCTLKEFAMTVKRLRVEIVKIYTICPWFLSIAFTDRLLQEVNGFLP
uniref:Uncharacterized protein n=1 Tax=Moniliophthora roreri TaxID=221103 RepID=A0A0W0GF52_MONRR